jgi:plastocyanin
MSSGQWVMLLVVIPLVLVTAFFVGRAVRHQDAPPGLQIGSAGDATQFDWDFEIPVGTADRIAAGEAIQIVPSELVVHVGDTIRIINNDTHNHIVGVFYVAAGEVLTQRFESAGVFQGECTVHSGGSFTLRVEP